MTDSDLQLIERELAISLPDSYKHFVAPFQIPAMQGNTDSQLWDNAVALIALNRELRAGSRFRPPWPPHLFALGDPHGDEIIAVDTRTTEGPVWWLDHGMVDKEASGQTHERFSDWAEEFFRDTREDLSGDGYDPEGSPAALERARSVEAKRSLIGCLVVIGVVLVLAIAFVVLRR